MIGTKQYARDYGGLSLNAFNSTIYLYVKIVKRSKITSIHAKRIISFIDAIGLIYKF